MVRKIHSIFQLTQLHYSNLPSKLSLPFRIDFAFSRLFFSLKPAIDIEKIVLKPSYEHNILLSSGDVLQFGKNLDPAINSFISTPARIGLSACIAKGEKIIDLVGGWGHLVALTDAGRVITWGSNKHGQTGQGEDAPKYSQCAFESDLRERISATDTGNRGCCLYFAGRRC
jgi:hypothetical protein